MATTEGHHPNSQKIHLWGWLEKYTSRIYKRPWAPIAFTIIVTVALTVWLLVSYGVHPGGNANNYRWSGHNTTDRWDAYVAAGKGTYPSLLGLFGSTIPLPKQFQLTQMGAMIYERPHQNLVVAEALADVWRMENQMHALPGWSDYCFKVPLNGLPNFLQTYILDMIDAMKFILAPMEPDTHCIAFKSIFTEIKIYMNATLHIRDPKPEDLTDQIIWDFFNWTGSVEHNDTTFSRLYQTYMGNDLKVTPPIGNATRGVIYGTRMRSMFPFGLPIAGYRNKGDREKEQTQKLGDWQLKFIQPGNELQKKRPHNVAAYCGFPFALDYQIADLILRQVWWLVGSFAFLFVFSVIVMRSFFVSLLGVLGVFFPIPCALVIMNGVCQIKYVDAIDVIALFLICGIGADCVFIIFELFRQSRLIYGHSNRKRLAYAAQRGLIALATSITTSGVSFLALLTSGVRVMNFFGVYSFFLLLFTFIFTFTWYLGILAIWARYFEPRSADEKEEFDTIPSQEVTRYTDTDTSSTSIASLEEIDYPHPGLFDFLRYKPDFEVDAASIDVSTYNAWERFFYNYISPVIYFYRLPIIIVFLVWAAVFGGLAFKMGTKSELVFLGPDHPLQRAYTLSLNGFSTALNDFSFVFVWGINPKPVVQFHERLTTDSYGSATYWDFDIENRGFQEHIRWTWAETLQRPFINPVTTATFGASPWELWRDVFDIRAGIYNTSMLGDLLFSTIFIPFIGTVGLNFTDLPSKFPIEIIQYDTYGWLWQFVLSALLYQEPDSYVPGTLKANTVGFSLDDYSLRFIGMKANMNLPPDMSVESMRALFRTATDWETAINKRAVEHGQPEGWMTGVAWLQMITEEQLPKQVIKDVGAAFGFAAIVILISTLSILYTIYVIISMTSTIFLIMGILYFTGWKIGCNEAIMVSIASGFCADFIIQPMIALSHDYSGRSMFGKIQASLVTFCTPVSCALVTTLVAAAFLYPCEIRMFPPFATFLIGSGVFGIIHGFVVLPAWIGLFSFNRRGPLECPCCEKRGSVEVRDPFAQPSAELFPAAYAPP